MITIKEINVINNSLDRLKPTLYGLNAKYEASIIEENVKYNLTSTSSRVISHYYKPILKIKVDLSGQPDIYILTAGMLKWELEGFLGKIFGYVLPRNHFLNSNLSKITYVFEYYGKLFNYDDIIKSFKYNEYVKKFRMENSPGTLEMLNKAKYSINYSDLVVSEYTDLTDLNFNIECYTESFNYIDRNGKVTLITDELWDAFLYETEEPIDMVKESLIKYLNTTVVDYHSELSNEFANDMSFMEKLSPYVKDVYSWRYDAMCSSLVNPNDYPYDYGQGDVERKNMFLSFCELYLDND